MDSLKKRARKAYSHASSSSDRTVMVNAARGGYERGAME